MKLSKPKSIQGLTEIKRLKPIGKLLQIEDWQNGAIVDSIKIILLISHVNYNAMMIIEDGKEWTGEKALIIDSHLLIVKRLFERMDDGYIMQKEFNRIKRDFKVKFDD